MIQLAIECSVQAYCVINISLKGVYYFCKCSEPLLSQLVVPIIMHESMCLKHPIHPSTSHFVRVALLSGAESAVSCITEPLYLFPILHFQCLGRCIVSSCCCTATSCSFTVFQLNTEMVCVGWLCVALSAQKVYTLSWILLDPVLDQSEVPTVSEPNWTL